MNWIKLLRRTGSLALCASLSAGCLIGCRGSDLNPESDLELRYDAAARIGAAAERDQAMVAVATDSADQGETVNARRALDQIGNRALRNDTAAECAVRLVKVGQRADANLIAMTINDPGKRNAAYKRLAENDPGSTDPAGKGVRNYLGD